MSVEITYPIWMWSKQKGAHLLLLVAIGDYANAEGIAWPSIASLSKRTRMSARYVQKMLREIESDGELEIIKRTNTSNVYRVRIQRPINAELPGEPRFTPPLIPSSRPPDPEFTLGVIPVSPNPSVDPSTIRDDMTMVAESIYHAYPKRVGKQGAIKAIKKALALKPAEALLKASRLYAEAVATWPESDRVYIPHPATWFNRGSYEDDPQNWKRNDPHQKSNGRGFSGSNLSAFEELDRKMAAGQG